MIALSTVTWWTRISWQPRDCTLEAGTAPNSRIYCPRYVTFPSYKPSGEWPFYLLLSLCEDTVIAHGKRIPIQICHGFAAALL